MLLDQFKAAFLDEAAELLETLETDLLALEENLNDRECLESVFRIMHTLKGSAGMVDFKAIVTLAHELETAFDMVREGKLQITDKLTSLALRGKDQFEKMIREDNNGDEDEVNAIINAAKEMVGGIDSSETANAAESNKPEKPSKNVSRLFLVNMKPHENMTENGSNPFFLIEELMELGECKLKLSFPNLPNLSKLNPIGCYAEWQLLILTEQQMGAIKDVFIFVEDECDVDLKELTDSDSAQLKEVQDALFAHIDVGETVTDQLISEIISKYPNEIAEVEQPEPNVPEKAENTSVEKPNVEKQKSVVKEVVKETTIRVPSSKLDELVNLVGELVTLNAQLTQISTDRNDPFLVAATESLDRLTAQLRDSALNMRMLPVGTLFSKFSRLARDLGRDLEKDINLVTSGEETELDKTVIERLNDPMVHLIRNCADHGIETPEIRESNGKPAAGTVSLTAQYSGANVLIEIKDDGKGLDVESIRKKAIDRELIDPAAKITDSELFQFVFHPGFSTAKSITKVSGRGVGLDVVRRTIEELNGTITLHSEIGKGTSFKLKLPLTMAIIDGLLVSVGDVYYVLPLTSVQECLEFSRDIVGQSKDQNLIDIRGKLTPYINLRNHFNVTCDEPEIQQVIVTEVNRNLVGFVVDEVIGQHQTVIKSLGKIYKDLDGLSGATILGDGTVAVILDTQGLYSKIQSGVPV